MNPSLFTPKEKSVTLLRTTTLTIPQIADKLGCGFNHINNCNRALHQKVSALTGIEDVTGMMVLGVGVATGEITDADLLLMFATMGIRFNK